jgi:predicted RNase H-like HicB family nuclease
MRYTVILFPEGNGYVARVPAIPNCTTQGDTIEEALAMAQDAAQALLDNRAEHGEWLPEEEPGAIVGSVDVRFPGEAGAAA